MNCAICGKTVPEGSDACSHCGTRVMPAGGTWSPVSPDAGERPEAVAPADPLPGEFRASQSAGSQSGSTDPASPAPGSAIYGRKPPRRRRTALIVIASILVVLIAGGFIAYQVFGRDIRRQLMGPKKSYLMIEGLAMKNGMDRLAGSIADTVNKEDKPIGLDTGLSFKLAAPLPGIDANLMRTINSLKLQTRSLMDRKASGPKLYTKTDLLTGSEQLLSLEMFAAENQLTVGSPGLIQQYIAIPVNDQAPADPMDFDGPIGLQSFSAYVKMSFEKAPLVDKIQLAGSLNKVANVFLANIDSAEFANNVPVTAGGVSVPYECYTMKSNGRQLRDMAVGTLELIRDEKPLNELIYAYIRNAAFTGFGGLMGTTGGIAPRAGTDQPMSESEFKAKLNEAIDRLKNVKDTDLQDLSFTQKVYVDNQDRIHGRELNVIKASTKAFVDLKVLAPVKDARHGLLVALAIDGKDSSVGDGMPFNMYDVQFTTNYEVKDGLKTGSADIMTEGKTPLTITYRGLGTKSDGIDERLIGEIDLNVDAGSLKSSMPIPKLTFKGTVNNGRYVMDFNAANLATLTVEQSHIPAADIKIPSLAGKTVIQANDQAALNRLMTLDVQMKLMSILQKLNISPSTLF